MMELRHPSIISILGLYHCQDMLQACGGQPPFLCIAMPCISGRPLREFVTSPQPTLAFRVGRQLVDALVYMHQREICHGDVWPSNIMISDTQNLTLVDLGSARPCGSREYQGTARRKLNVGYSSPEALQGYAPSPEQDCWAVGIVLAEVSLGSLLPSILGSTDALPP